MIQTVFGLCGFLFTLAFLVSAVQAIGEDYHDNFHFNGSQLRIVFRDGVALAGGFCACLCSFAVATEGFLKMVMS